MNTQEKIIAILLGLLLVGYFWFDHHNRTNAAAASAQASAEQRATGTLGPEAPAGALPGIPGGPSLRTSGSSRASSATTSDDTLVKSEMAPEGWAEQTAIIANSELELIVTTKGTAIKQAVLKKYAQKAGEMGEDNPAYVMELGEDGLGGLKGVYADEVSVEGTTATFKRGGEVVRTITLKDGYLIDFAGGEGTLSLGAVAMGGSKNDLLSVDAWDLSGKKPHVVHYSETEPLKGYLAGLVGGCSSSSNAAGMPKVSAPIKVGGNFTWVALKNRFFVAGLTACDGAPALPAFTTVVTRDMASEKYRPESVAAYVEGVSGTQTFYVGPKAQANLTKLGMRDVMEFGMWRWLCYPLVWILNKCYAAIPNYGIAIIILTILVRLVFWPLTHKSTVGMKKMSEIQPLMKEIQAKYKGNPQRLQQETMKLYRDHHVNPLSSCLPMLIQIPVFIALFNVLRSAVELRYANFLWIADLSEPEALFASWFPFGGLNILPILMAATMALQSALTPQAGDKSQQRMMIVMMPVMMLVMFYNFPSALSLYWTLSQVLSIAQMYWIRKHTAAK